MVEQLQRVQAHGSRSQGARLLAALKDKTIGGRQSGAGTTPAYRTAGPNNTVLPFPVLVAPSPAVPSMPSRRDGVGAHRDGVRGGGNRDPYELEDDGEDYENSNPAATSGKGAGVTIGKRRVLGGSEAKKQSHLPSLFSREHKRLQTARLTPAGMVNLGNTCYLNSVVQVLLNMACFTRDLRDPALELLEQHLPAAGVWSALCTTADKLRTATSARLTFDSLKPAVEPSELRAAMGRRGSRWRSFAQQDAHEFLVELLEGLQSEVLAAEAAAWGRRRMPLSETRCPTARNLSGSLMHTWSCSTCGRCTRLKEPFSCLSLQLPAHGTVNLQDLVSEYLKEEVIDKNCEGCSPSGPVPHTAQHHFWRLPRVLVVHIKRFMPLPQQQQAQQQQQQAALPRVPHRQGSAGGDTTTHVVTAAALAVEEPEAAAHAAAPNVPGTPGRDDTAPAREPEVATVGAAGASAAAAAGSRDPTPPAPYLYAKVHTVVKVTAGLELGRHCDAAARAHEHLLEGLSAEARAAAISMRVAAVSCGPGDGDDGAAAAGGSAARSGGRALAAGGGGSGGRGATPTGRLPGATTGGTLDTAGGGSTCPSPSFMQTILQERTVQQNGTGPPKDLRQRAALAASKAVTPGGVRLRAPESECGTSAVSTGAQAEAGDGAPTPYGGVGGGHAALPESVRRQSEQAARRSPLGADGSWGGAVGPSPAMARPQEAGKCGGQAGRPEAVSHGSTPQASLQRAGKGLPVGNGACQATPTGTSMGDGLSSHTDNDRLGPAAQQPQSVARGGGCTTHAAAYSERKAPRTMGAGAFFGPPGAATEPRIGGGLGPARRGSGGGGGSGHQGNADAPNRPLKRICVEDATPTPTRRRASEAPGSAATAVTARRLEEMTEDEQLQLALQMSMAQEAGAAVGVDGGADGTIAGLAAASGPVGPGPPDTVLNLSMPTAAATAAAARSGRGAAGFGAGGARACVSGDSTGGGRTRARAQCAGQDDEGAGGDDGDFVTELQDESQGGTGQGGGGGGQGSLGGVRPANSGPAMSGASGGNNDGDESDCSADQAYRGCSGGGGAALGRHKAARPERRRKRRVANLFHYEDVPDAAESPAVPPPQQQQQRRQVGSGYGYGGGGGCDLNDGHPVAYSIDDDDGTTALSPVSGNGKRPALAGAGGGGGSSKDVRGAGGRVAEGAAAADGQNAAREDVQMVPADDDQDADLAEVLRLSMATFEAEEKERELRISFGGAADDDTGAPHQPGGGAAGNAQKSKTAREWERMQAIPDVEDAAAAAAAPAAAGAGCSTPRRGVAPTERAGSPHRPLRRRTGVSDGGERRTCDPGAYDEDGGHGGVGMDAARADAAPAGADGSTWKRVQPSARCGSADAGHGRAGSAAQDPARPFKFNFPPPGASAGAAGASGGPAGGLGLAGAGSRREEALDLTGVDDEDADLHKAIMLSLREANGEDTAMVDAAEDAARHSVMDLAGADAEAGEANGMAPAQERPKVMLVPDSDYEDDSGDDEIGDGMAAAPSAGAATTVAGKSQAAAAATEGATALNGSQRSRRREEVALGGTAASVPLAQLARYRLQGVVRHKGLTPFSGHYVADVLVPNPSGVAGQIWYEHNDAVVSHVDFDRVREDAAQQGYLFFFVNTPKPVTTVAAAVAAAAAKPLPDDC